MLVALAGSLVGCRHDDTDARRAVKIESGDSTSLVAGSSDRDTTIFIRKIDGMVEAIVAGSFTADEPQVAVHVGNSSGADQGSLYFITQAGDQRATYRCRATPDSSLFPEIVARHQVNFPERGTMLVAPRNGRRFIAFATKGDYSPSALVILEAAGPETLVERAVLWNVGHFGATAHRGRYVACAGYDNAREFEAKRYGASVIVVDLDSLADRDRTAPALTAVMPCGQAQEVPPGEPVILFAELPTDDLGGEAVETVALTDDACVVRLLGGLSWRISLTDLGVTPTVTQRYHEDYALRREGNRALADSVDEHLRGLAAKAIVHR